MATSFLATLNVTSAVGFKRSHFYSLPTASALEGGVGAPRPLMTTTYTLNGITQPDITFSNYKLISVQSLNEFVFYPGGTSDSQTVRITNEGDLPVTISDIRFSTNNATPIIDQTNSQNFPVIPPGTTGTFEISYTGNRQGVFSNWISIINDTDAVQYKLITNQFVNDILEIIPTPDSVNVLIFNDNEVKLVPIILTPILNGEVDTTINLDFTYSITGSTGWTVQSTGTNLITVKFDSAVVSNANGTFTAALQVEDINIPLSASIGIIPGDNVNLGSWRSAYGRTNSIVGISYDKIKGVKTITIGIFYIDDNNTGITTFPEGAAQNVDLTTLGIGAEFLTKPFTNWHTVYRIPLDLSNPKKQYYSQDYIVKSQEFDWGEYFGENQAPKSIFIVESDEYGNVKIVINNLTNLTDINAQELYYSFYYYVPFRPTKLSSPILDGYTTELFVGFNNNGTVRTNHVPIPPMP